MEHLSQKPWHQQSLQSKLWIHLHHHQTQRFYYCKFPPSMQKPYPCFHVHEPTRSSSPNSPFLFHHWKHTHWQYTKTHGTHRLWRKSNSCPVWQLKHVPPSFNSNPSTNFSRPHEHQDNQRRWRTYPDQPNQQEKDQIFLCHTSIPHTAPTLRNQWPQTNPSQFCWRHSW